MRSIPTYTNHSMGDGAHSDIKKVVAGHGPAVSHQHFSDGETHGVVSQHEDGHTHLSLGHPSFGHALEHIGIAHGTD